MIRTVSWPFPRTFRTHTGNRGNWDRMRGFRRRRREDFLEGKRSRGIRPIRTTVGQWSVRDDENRLLDIPGDFFRPEAPLRKQIPHGRFELGGIGSRGQPDSARTGTRSRRDVDSPESGDGAFQRPLGYLQGRQIRPPRLMNRADLFVCFRLIARLERQTSRSITRKKNKEQSIEIQHQTKPG